MNRQLRLFTEIPHLEICPEDPYPYGNDDYLYEHWNWKEKLGKPVVLAEVMPLPVDNVIPIRQVGVA